MANAFSRLSLVIDVADEWYRPDTLVLRAPGEYEPRRSRIVMHETLHWWQQLGHGSMTWLAAEEWRRLQQFEATGVVPPVGPRLRAFVEKDEASGLSGWLLNESLTRFWDIHICGPLAFLDLERAERRWTDAGFWERYDALRRAGRLTGPDGTGYSDRAYALAMDGAGGRYALPYRRIVEQTSPAVAGIIFPIAAHLAFQTARPVEYFHQFVDAVIPYARTLRPDAVESLWLDCYFTARQLAAPIIRRAGEQPLLPIVEIRESSLAEHPGYGRALTAMEYWTGRLSETGPGQAVARHLPNLDARIASLLALDIFLATPGVPEHRGGLYQMFPPPVVRFTDGSTWLLGDIHRRELHPEWTDEERGLLTWQQSAADALAIDERWTALLQARYETG